MDFHISQPTRKVSCGFTLIEMIGVMAIMAILSASIVPNVINQVVQAKADQEVINLKTLAENLQGYIKKNKTIPALGNVAWSTAAASMSDMPINKVALNERNFSRGYYVDPQFFSTTDSTFPGYNQQNGLSSPPVSPRIMLVSNMNADAPPMPTTSATFSAIWNQSKAAALIESDTIKIVRLNLKSLFQRVTIINEKTNQAAYQLESGPVYSVSAAVGGVDSILTRYVIASTRVNLYTDPFPSGSLDHIFLVQSDEHYRYQLIGSDWSWVKP